MNRHGGKADNAGMESPMSNLNKHPNAGASLAMLHSRETSPGYSDHREWVRALLAVTASDSVIEVGCGTGVHLPHFARAGARVTALEPSTHLREQALRASETATILGDTWESVELEDAYSAFLFDKVLTHLPDPLEALEKARLHAQPLARIVVVNLDGMATSVNPGVDPADRGAVERILAWRASHGTASGWASTSAPTILEEAGWTFAETQAWTITLATREEAEKYTPLSGYGEKALAAGGASEEDVERWQRIVSKNPTTFSCLLTVRADIGMLAANS